MANLEFWIWMRKVFIILFSPLSVPCRGEPCHTCRHLQGPGSESETTEQARAAEDGGGQGLMPPQEGWADAPGPPQLQRLEVSIFVSCPHFKILTTDTHLFLNLGPQKCAHSLTVVCHLLVYDLWWGCSVVSWTTCLTPGCFVETLKQRKTF